MNDEFKNLWFDVLGMNDNIFCKLCKFICEFYGMVFVIGLMGLGKMMMFYVCLLEIQSLEDKIIMIEDLVEYQLCGIMQILVNEKKGLIFVCGLCLILCYDLDKIMVGEI